MTHLFVNEWRGVLRDHTIADAIMDRLVNYNSYRIETKGFSMH